MAAAQPQNVQQILHALLSSPAVNHGQVETGTGTIVISAGGFQGRVSTIAIRNRYDGKNQEKKRQVYSYYRLGFLDLV